MIGREYVRKRWAQSVIGCLDWGVAVFVDCITKPEKHVVFIGEVVGRN